MMGITPIEEERNDLVVVLIFVFTVGRVVLGTKKAKTAAGKKRDIVMMPPLTTGLEGSPVIAAEIEVQEWLGIL